MNTHVASKRLSEARQRRLHVSERCIARQQRIAEMLQERGQLRAARRARELLAAFVRSHFLMHEAYLLKANALEP
jgi:hypothetical protein